MEIKDVVVICISLLSLLVSGFAILLSISEKRKREFEVRKEYTVSILNWHERVVSLVTQLELKNIDEDTRCVIATQLESLYFEGKYYFPNVVKGDKFGAEKPPYNRNYRNAVLEFVLLFAELFKDKSYRCNPKTLKGLLSLFMAEVFKYSDPYEYREKALRKDIKNIQEKALEDIYGEVKRNYPEVAKYLVKNIT